MPRKTASIRYHWLAGMALLALGMGACGKSEMEMPATAPKQGAQAGEMPDFSKCITLAGGPVTEQSKRGEVLCDADDVAMQRTVLRWAQASEAEKKQAMAQAIKSPGVVCVDEFVPNAVVALRGNAGDAPVQRAQWPGPVTPTCRERAMKNMSGVINMLDTTVYPRRIARLRLYEMTAKEAGVKSERAQLAQTLAQMVRDRETAVRAVAAATVLEYAEELIEYEPEKGRMTVRMASTEVADKLLAKLKEWRQQRHGVGFWRRVEMRVTGSTPRVQEWPADFKLVLPGFQSLTPEIADFGLDLFGSLDADLAAAGASGGGTGTGGSGSGGGTGASAEVPSDLQGTYTADSDAKGCGAGGKMVISARHVEVSDCKHKAANALVTVTKVEVDGAIHTITLEGKPTLTLKRGDDGKLNVPSHPHWAGSWQR